MRFQRSRKITTPGVQGERTIKTRIRTNGQVVGRQELSSEET